MTKSQFGGDWQFCWTWVSELYLETQVNHICHERRFSRRKLIVRVSSTGIFYQLKLVSPVTIDWMVDLFDLRFDLRPVFYFNGVTSRPAEC